MLLGGRWPRKRNEVKIRCDIMRRLILRPWRGGERLSTTPPAVNLLMRFIQRTLAFNVECLENLNAAVVARCWCFYSANRRNYSGFLYFIGANIHTNFLSLLLLIDLSLSVNGRNP